MRIKTLILTSFGKFKDRIIEVDEGFNLIYGENETGKSTVQHFIEGIFFGFYKPYRKKRTYSEDYERFKPWNSERYCGAIIINDDHGKDIRIERDFLKKQDGVTIYDNITGENITHLYPYDNVTRQVLPLGDMKINSVVYNNTVNIKQMAGESDTLMAQEVNDRLLEMGTEKNDALSLNRAISYLNNKKKVIGNYGQRKSNYGAAVREIETLEQELVESEQIYAAIQKNQKRIQQYKKKINFAQNKFQNQAERSQKKTQQELENMKRKVDDIKAEGDALELQMQELSRYENFDMRIYGRLKILQSNADGASERIEGLVEEIKELEKKQNDVSSRCERIKLRLKNLSRSEIQSDYQKYHYALENKAPIQREQEIIESKIFNLNRVSSGLLILMIVIGAVLILGMAVNPGNIVPRVVSLFVSFLGWVAALGATGLLIYKSKSTGVYEEPKVKKEPVVLLDAVEVILQKYGKSTNDEYETFVAKAEEIFSRMD
ncbi:MAG: AAA family ATPase, partial [Eubacterium sp.]